MHLLWLKALYILKSYLSIDILLLVIISAPIIYEYYGEVVYWKQNHHLMINKWQILRVKLNIIFLIQQQYTPADFYNDLIPAIFYMSLLLFT